jgi:hypothetical protein
MCAKSIRKVGRGCARTMCMCAMLRTHARRRTSPVHARAGRDGIVLHDADAVQLLPRVPERCDQGRVGLGAVRQRGECSVMCACVAVTLCCFVSHV